MIVQRIEPPKGFDMGTTPGLGAEIVAAGGFTLPCASNCSDAAKWYVAAVRPLREVEAATALDKAGFGAFLPMILAEVRHARKTEIVTRPAFRGYVFVRLDLADPRWRTIREVGRKPWKHGPVSRLMGARPEAPTPLPAGAVQRLISAGFDRPITDDIAPALLPTGAAVSIAEGPFTDHRGVCLWDSGVRVRVLLALLGRSVSVELDRRQVVPS